MYISKYIVSLLCFLTFKVNKNRIHLDLKFFHLESVFSLKSCKAYVNFKVCTAHFGYLHQVTNSQLVHEEYLLLSSRVSKLRKKKNLWKLCDYSSLPNVCVLRFYFWWRKKITELIFQLQHTYQNQIKMFLTACSICIANLRFLWHLLLYLLVEKSLKIFRFLIQANLPYWKQCGYKSKTYK